MRARTILFILVVLSLVMRTYLSFTAAAHSDEVIINARSIEIIAADRISTIDQMPLFHWFLDVLYQVFDPTFFAARFGSIIFGSFIPVLVFLLSRHYFTKQVSLVAASLSTFSAYLLRYQPESNTTMTFFFLLSTLLFLDGLKNKNMNYFVLAFIFAGVSTLIKTIALMLIPVFLILYFVHRKEIPFLWPVYGSVFYFVMMIPILAYNLILYAQKGILDMLFIRYFPVPKNPYADLLHGGGLSLIKVFINIRDMTFNFVKRDPLLFILIMLGIGLVCYFYFQAYQQKKFTKQLPKHTWELGLLVFVPSLFLFASSLMAKHYVTTTSILCIFAAYGLVYIANKFSKEISTTLLIFFVCYVAVAAFCLSDYIEQDPGIGLERMSYDLPKDSLVITDNRIYRGAYNFPFDRHNIIGAKHFLDVVEHSLARPRNELQDFTVYFLECAVKDDDCTGAEHTKVNETIERMITAFISGGEVIDEVSYGGEPVYRMHKSIAPLIKDFPLMARKVNHFYFHNPRWEDPNRIVDWYDPEHGWQSMLHTFAKVVLWVGLILMLVGLVLGGYWLYKLDQ